MIKKAIFIFCALTALPNCAMQMAAQQSEQDQKKLDETAAKELIKKLVGKKYTDLVSQLSKISDENKELIRNVLHKNHSLFTSQVRFQQTLSGHRNWIKSVTFSPNGRFALTGSDDTTARLWDVTKSPVTSSELIGHTGLVRSVAFSPDGRFALTGSWDNTARLWDLTKSPITCTELIGHTCLISSVTFSPDSCFALTGSYDDTARLWDLTKSPITSKILTDHEDSITSVAFS